MDDLETGAHLLLDASDAGTRRQFQSLNRAAYGRTREMLKNADIDCIEIDTAASAADALIRYFRQRERRR